MALKLWLAVLPAVFPAGTYKLRGKPGVVIKGVARLVPGPRR